MLTTQRQTVHLPGSEAYEALRKPLNAALDPRPAMVVEAYGVADVRAAVLMATERNLPLAVQATGHGTHTEANGALLLRTTAMDEVEIDPIRRVAKVGPGARWGAVIDAAAPYGLVPLAGSSRDVGVTGFTLGGGVGWLSRRYGFAADSVIRAQVVTADGRLVSTDEHPDLLWALKGGGGSFGLVTELEFRLYPVKQVWAGIIPFQGDYRALTEKAPDTLSTALIISPEGTKLKVMSTVPVEGFEAIPFREAVMGGTPARHLDFFTDLHDDVMEMAVEAGKEATVEIRHWGGAMAGHRGPVAAANASYSVIVSQALPGLAEAFGPHATGGSFLNFLADTGRTPDAFTGYERLAEAKRAWDPRGLFSVGHSIR
ncbi:FAD-dependent oxidoreductase [Nonomuraea soli]|uniref:FAD/FMN-containing dehydrogenase n=1 Tax=Nonomuraea soli TaxID=1032476 RepID=A0A7W0CRB1_9ACTN|nr:FAD-binding oxidoreductase [Nonomuraea soli]MBA2895758.1 FAD/FMN-containing dehydrogenase [Nonomuraea soli]